MNQSRKQFINTASISLLGLFLCPGSFPADLATSKPLVVHAEEGETYWVGSRNSPLTIKIAKDRDGIKTMSFCTEEIASGEGIPLHKHLNEDELIFLHAGEGILTIGKEEIPVKKGSVALIPQKTWHSLKNTGAEMLTMVFSYSPAGFEGYFRELGTPAGTLWQPKPKDEYKKLNQKWGIVYA